MMMTVMVQSEVMAMRRACSSRYIGQFEELGQGLIIHRGSKKLIHSLIKSLSACKPTSSQPICHKQFP
jgi:hypothetical protein